MSRCVVYRVLFYFLKYTCALLLSSSWKMPSCIFKGLTFSCHLDLFEYLLLRKHFPCPPNLKQLPCHSPQSTYYGLVVFLYTEGCMFMCVISLLECKTHVSRNFSYSPVHLQFLESIHIVSSQDLLNKCLIEIHFNFSSSLLFNSFNVETNHLVLEFLTWFIMKDGILRLIYFISLLFLNLMTWAIMC